MASPLNNLAELYREQGKYTEAEPLFRRALYIREQQLGPEHPRVAYPLSGLAYLYFLQGKYAEAEPLFRRALRIREQQLGSEHPDVASTLNRLANLYREQGKYVEAGAGQVCGSRAALPTGVADSGAASKTSASRCGLSTQRPCESLP